MSTEETTIANGVERPRANRLVDPLAHATCQRALLSHNMAILRVITPVFVRDDRAISSMAAVILTARV